MLEPFWTKEDRKTERILEKSNITRDDRGGLNLELIEMDRS